MFKSKGLKGKQEELQGMAYIDCLEETGKVSVYDLSMEEIEELQEVLQSLNYQTDFNNDVLVLTNAEEKKEYRQGSFKRKLIKSKGGSGGVTYRISIPVDLIRELELEEEEELTLSISSGSIVIDS